MKLGRLVNAATVSLALMFSASADSVIRPILMAAAANILSLVFIFLPPVIRY